VLDVNAQAVMQKNNEAWNSFFSLLKSKKEGKLLPFMNRVSPPRYWKEGETKERGKLLLVVRQDRYLVDEQNRIILEDFDLEVEFVGRLSGTANKVGWRYTTTKQEMRGTPPSPWR